MRRWVLGCVVLGGIVAPRAAIAGDERYRVAPACGAWPGAVVVVANEHGSRVGERLHRVARHWLLDAPEANPAMLAMFRDRDRTPPRDLLPWSGEFAGKHLTGATQVAKILNPSGEDRLNLDARLDAFVAELTALQAEDGYLGPFPRGHRLTGSAPNVGEKGGPTWDAWGHYHVMLGLLLRHRARPDDAEALAAARRIGDLFCDRFLGDKRPRLVDTGSTEMNLAPAHGLCLLYEATGEERYLDLARQIVDQEFAATDDQGRPLAGDYLRRGLANEPFYKTPKPRWESLHPIMALAELYWITGEEPYRRAFENLWWSIVEFDRHNNGGFSSGEQAQGNPYHTGAIETCCTIAWMAMCVEMLRLTGDPIVADELELSTLNSALGLYHPSGRWSTYNTPMDGVRRANFHEIVFQARPGSPELNCCSVNAARGLGLIGEWALMGDAEGVRLNWYGPGAITGAVLDGGSITLWQETDYPRSGDVKITVNVSHPQVVALRLRIPHWSEHTTVKVNGEAVEGVEPGRYLALRRKWDGGDVIELSFDMTPHAWFGERESAGRVSLYRGPILLTYDPRFNPGREGDDPPPIPARGIGLNLVEPENARDAWILAETTAVGGDTIRLCDFAGAGADGTSYRSWLRVEGGEPRPFTRARPWRTVPVGRIGQ
jgi:DUF1680 family protein